MLPLLIVGVAGLLTQTARGSWVANDDSVNLTLVGVSCEHGDGEANCQYQGCDGRWNRKNPWYLCDSQCIVKPRTGPEACEFAFDGPRYQSAPWSATLELNRLR